MKKTHARTHPHRNGLTHTRTHAPTQKWTHTHTHARTLTEMGGKVFEERRRRDRYGIPLYWLVPLNLRGVGCTPGPRTKAVLSTMNYSHDLNKYAEYIHRSISPFLSNEMHMMIMIMMTMSPTLKILEKILSAPPPFPPFPTRTGMKSSVLINPELCTL